MSYTALYRKWRPAVFDDVKGQDAIVTTLKNQIKSGRIGHAYLFCGTRGTGKTSVAKIMAKAVNCENPKDGSPCGECAMCRSISSGASMNVIEIDAASNNGVDDVREIRDEVNYSPAEGKYKVYIVDEAHMLSPAAFNALLKTLEEPPSYVIFILATTEVHKIPVTILSRCQRYDFKRITVERITDRLNELMAAEGIEAEEKAVRYIAKTADGAMRDALSLLDQCVAFYFGQKLTYDKVLEVLGAVDTRIHSSLARSIIARNVPDALKIVEDAVLMGRDLTQFVNEFAWYLRNLLLLKTADKAEELLDISKENQELLKTEAEAVDINTLMRFIRIFAELSDSLKYATQKRILFEIAIIKICRPEMETDMGSMLDRIKVLEDKLENGDFAVRSNNTSGSDKENENEQDIAKPELPKALSEDIKKVVSNWPSLIAQMPPGVTFALKTAVLSAREDNKLIICVVSENLARFLNMDFQRESIQKTINKALGKDVGFEIVGAREGHRPKDEYVDLSKIIQMEIEEED